MRAPEASIACTVLASSASVSGRNGGLAANAMRSSGCRAASRSLQLFQHLGAPSVEADRQAALLRPAAHQPHQRRAVHAAGLAQPEAAQHPDQRYTVGSHQVGGVHAALEFGRVEGLHHHVDGRHADHGRRRPPPPAPGSRPPRGWCEVRPPACRGSGATRRARARRRARAGRACAAVRALAGRVRRGSNLNPTADGGAACEFCVSARGALRLSPQRPLADAQLPAQEAGGDCRSPGCQPPARGLSPMHRRVRLARTLALAAGLALAACSGQRAPDAGLPPGALLLARTAALHRLLATAATLEGTPLARQARALAARLPACDWTQAQADASSQLRGCARLRRPDRPAGGAPPRARRARPRVRASRGRARAPDRRRGRRRGRDARRLAAAPARRARGPGRLSAPGRRAGRPAPCSPRVSSSCTRACARTGASTSRPSCPPRARPRASSIWRARSSAGSCWMAPGRRRSICPRRERATPRSALALGVRERTAAIAAIEAFIEKIRESWPVQRSAFSVGAASGACLLDLNLLPDLAPCYVATERALVVGWNPASLRHALAGEMDVLLELGAPGALVLDLARVEEADARLRARLPAGAAGIAAGVSLAPGSCERRARARRCSRRAAARREAERLRRGARGSPRSRSGSRWPRRASASSRPSACAVSSP